MVGICKGLEPGECCLPFCSAPGFSNNEGWLSAADGRSSGSWRGAVLLLGTFAAATDTPSGGISGRALNTHLALVLDTHCRLDGDGILAGDAGALAAAVNALVKARWARRVLGWAAGLRQSLQFAGPCNRSLCNHSLYNRSLCNRTTAASPHPLCPPCAPGGGAGGGRGRRPAGSGSCDRPQAQLTGWVGLLGRPCSYLSCSLFVISPSIPLTLSSVFSSSSLSFSQHMSELPADLPSLPPATNPTQPLSSPSPLLAQTW